MHDNMHWIMYYTFDTDDIRGFEAGGSFRRNVTHVYTKLPMTLERIQKKLKT